MSGICAVCGKLLQDPHDLCLEKMRVERDEARELAKVIVLLLLEAGPKEHVIAQAVMLAPQQEWLREVRLGRNIAEVKSFPRHNYDVGAVLELLVMRQEMTSRQYNLMVRRLMDRADREQRDPITKEMVVQLASQIFPTENSVYEDRATTISGES